MIGIVTAIHTKTYGKFYGEHYGYIKASDGEQYYFDSRFTSCNSMQGFKLDDIVEFLPQLDSGSGGNSARQVKKSIQYQRGFITEYDMETGVGTIDGNIKFNRHDFQDGRSVNSYDEQKAYEVLFTVKELNFYFHAQKIIVINTYSKSKQNGYISFFRNSNGYIATDDDYLKRKKSFIKFDIKDVINSTQIDNINNEYRVSFLLIVRGSVKIAKRVQILEITTRNKSAKSIDAETNEKCKSNSTELEYTKTDESSPVRTEYIEKENSCQQIDIDRFNYTTPEDICKFDFTEGETLVIRTQNNQIVGNFIEKTDKDVYLESINGKVNVLINDIVVLFFCGLITSYDKLGSTGLINDQYKFEIRSVFNRDLREVLTQGNASTYMCLYSLKFIGPDKYIAAVEYFSKDILKQITWQSGKIQGLYQKGDYFSIEKNCRCYESVIYDDTILKYIKDADFLFQDVYYKFVSHPTNDARRQGNLSQSAVEILSKYQLGTICLGSAISERVQTDVKEIIKNQKLLLCGSTVFPVPENVSLPETNKTVKVTLTCSGNQSPLISEINDRDLRLPSHSEELKQRKAEIARLKKTNAFLQLLDLYETSLDQFIINPDETIKKVFQIGIRLQDTERIEKILRKYGWQLERHLYHFFEMQLSAMQNDTDTAKEHAQKCVEMAEKHDFPTSETAKAVLADKIQLEDLRKYLNRFLGRINFYNRGTGQGNISWGLPQKLNFSRNDQRGNEWSNLDIENYIYTVSFIVDTNSTPPEAREVKIEDIEEKDDYEDNGTLGNYFPGDIRVTELLNFRCENCDPNGIKHHFRIGTQKSIEKSIDGNFGEQSEKGRRLLGVLARKTTMVQSSIKPNIMLVAALIHKKLRATFGVMSQDPNTFWNEKQTNNFLVQYAFYYLKSRHSELKPDEVEYYSRNIFYNEAFDAHKERCLAFCLESYFENTGGDGNLDNLISKPCPKLEGLAIMILNLPAEVLNELLNKFNDKKTVLLKEIATKMITMVGDDNRNDDSKQVIDNYYSLYQQGLEELKKNLRVSRQYSTIDNPQNYQDVLNNKLKSIGKFLFKSDQERLRELIQIFGQLVNIQGLYDIAEKVRDLLDVLSKIKDQITNIENQPSYVSFEILRPFLKTIMSRLSNTLNILYVQSAPKLEITHFDLGNNDSQEILVVSNDNNCLPARNIRININPYDNNDNFKIDNYYREIQGLGQTINGGHAGEFIIPIEISPTAKENSTLLEMEVTISYNRDYHHNQETGEIEEKAETMPAKVVQIPLSSTKLIPPEENKYRLFASGQAMDPTEEPKAKEMFFGRDEDIKRIYEEITNNNTLRKGSITAVCGQKRCGKTSVLKFLANIITQKHSKAIIASINAQGCTINSNNNKSEFYLKILRQILTAFEKEIRKKDGRFNDLRQKMTQLNIKMPTLEESLSPDGDIYFNEFFTNFQQEFPDYDIVLMVDEFTQVYTHMKEHKINEDFLNRWRAIVEDNGFVNIVVGQDFMDKFTTDNEVGGQNFGAARNGLATMKKISLSYLDEQSAEKMITTPVLLPNGMSRYQGSLGKEAITRIYHLTGGSPFYLMKFCNAIVDYMMAYGESLVSVSLVNKVASDHAFSMRYAPINIQDFDPIFNPYSAGEANDKPNSALGNTNTTIEILRIVAQRNAVGTCAIRDVRWHDENEKKETLKTLITRGVLVDSRGQNIEPTRIDSADYESLEVKIKVGLFSIFLAKRG